MPRELFSKQSKKPTFDFELKGAISDGEDKHKICASQPLLFLVAKR
jgi:hypothetical protein